ncbi:MAG: protoporphyrinogen oxidase HemJ [Hyphomicrobiaceae bacterium]
MDIALWVKALHIAAVISWMAGLFYLPRLFVHHAERGNPGSELSETFKMMEEKLLGIIMRPAMTVTWLTGLYLAWSIDAWIEGWFLIKALMVVAMTVFHVKCALWVKDFAADSNVRSGKYFRIANEVPTVLMLVIVLMVIVKPF